MDVETYRAYCLQKSGVTESFPFDEHVLVFKVGNKMFALANIDQFTFINLKCDPELAISLREEFDGITAGYHMSKKHWNSVKVDGSVSDQKVRELIDHSYDVILRSLPKSLRSEITKN